LDGFVRFFKDSKAYKATTTVAHYCLDVLAEAWDFVEVPIPIRDRREEVSQYLLGVQQILFEYETT